MSVTPPKNLCKIGRAKWRELAQLLSEADEAALTGLTIVCQAWARLQKAESKLADNGEDEQAQETIARSQRVIRQWMAELRLTPKSKARKQAEKPQDPILRLINNAK